MIINLHFYNMKARDIYIKYTVYIVEIIIMMRYNYIWHNDIK